MTTQLNEGLNFHDMEGHVTPLLGIDEFQSRIGDDSDVIVISFIVDGKEVGNDLVDWLERGYDWIIDAEVSPGEVLDKKFYVFAELNRRTTAPRRIIELLDDLNTLTGIKADDWEVKIYGQKYPASEDIIKREVPLTPSAYKAKDEGELNEWREIAGLKTVKTHDDSEDIIAWKRQAGIL